MENIDTWTLDSFLLARPSDFINAEHERRKAQFSPAASESRMDCLAGQQLLRRDESVVCADLALQETKILAYYFSAHWCPPCRLFTPLLAEFYSVSIQDPCLLLLRPLVPSLQAFHPVPCRVLQSQSFSIVEVIKKLISQ